MFAAFWVVICVYFVVSVVLIRMYCSLSYVFVDSLCFYV
jgi:hypothetical protein